MSAFVLETKGYDLLGQYLYDYSKSRHIMRNGYRNAVNTFLFGDWRKGYNASDDEIAKQVELRINNLISANYHAVEERYVEDEGAPYVEFKRRTILPAWSDVQLIKNLQCLRYQMSEGNVPNTPIYKMLSELIAGLCEAKVNNLNEYEKASWGW